MLGNRQQYVGCRYRFLPCPCIIILYINVIKIVGILIGTYRLPLTNYTTIRHYTSAVQHYATTQQ